MYDRSRSPITLSSSLLYVAPPSLMLGLSDINLGHGSGSSLPLPVLALAGISTVVAVAVSGISIWLQLRNYRKPLLQRCVFFGRTHSLTTLIVWFPEWSCESWSWCRCTRCRRSSRSSPWRQLSSLTPSATSTRCAYQCIRSIHCLRYSQQAFVIYCFFVLLLDYLGGERSLLILLHGRPPIPAVFPVSLWRNEIDPSDPYTFLFLKRGILRKVITPFLVPFVLTLSHKQNTCKSSLFSRLRV